MTLEALRVYAEVERRDGRASGEALLSLDAAGWSLVVARAGCDPLRVEGGWEDLGDVRADGERGLVLEVGRASRARLAFGSAADAAHVRDLLVRGCCTLPELTRALRSLGSRRSVATAGAAEADRFFEPLLVARRRAFDAGDVAAALDAFAGAPLRASLERRAAEVAAGRHPASRASARRALEARLCDELEPVIDALDQLDGAADGVRAADASGEGPVAAWRAWVAQLRRVFERADESWARLARELGDAGGPGAVPGGGAGR